MRPLFISLMLLLSFCVFSQEKLFWYIENARVGFKDSAGNIRIKPKYVMGNVFSEGMASVAVGENMFDVKWGFINTKGEWIVQPIFSAAGLCTDGLIRVQQNNKWGYVNKKGEWVIQPQFPLCYEFVNGYAQARKGTKWGLIDKKGAFIVPAVYYNITDYSGTVFAAQKEVSSKWEVLNIQNTKVSDKVFGRIRNFEAGLAPATDENGKYGFIDTKGEWVIAPAYSNAEYFSDGLAAVEINYINWGFIDKTGKLIIPATYDRHAYFVKGYALVEKGSEYMYINKKGVIVMRFSK